MKLLNINYQNRVYGLDIFRAVAILLVVKLHGSAIAGDLFKDLPWLTRVDGVELFFVLSGFLIGSILIKTVEKEPALNIASLVHFWKRRWFRTLPNYYLILFVNYLLVKYQIIENDIDGFSFKFLFFLQNFHEGFQGFFWESWSLSVEEWFYIFLPVLIWLFSKFLSKKNTLLFSIILLIIVPMGYRYAISGETIDVFLWDINFRKVVLTRLDAINWGVLAAYIKFYHPQIFHKSRNVMFVLGLAILGANSLIPRDPNHFYFKMFSFTLTSIGAALLLAKADSIKKFKYAFIGKIVTFISLISYAMYLVNLAVVSQVIDKNFPPQTLWENAYMYVVYWVVTIVISTLLYKFYEKPLTDLRDKWK